MTKLILDELLLGKLSRLDHRVAVCDIAGRTLGWYQPLSELDAYAGYECPLSEEELVRIENDQDGRPLADILRDLKGRA